MILSTNYMLLHSIHCYYTKTRTVSQWLAHLAQGHHGIQCRPQPAAVCRPHRLLLLELAEQRQGLRATRLHVVCQCCPQTDKGKDRKQRAVRRAICHLQTLHICSGRHTFPVTWSLVRVGMHISRFELCHAPLKQLYRNHQTTGDGVINRAAVTLMTFMMYGDQLKQSLGRLSICGYSGAVKYLAV